jgi:hypothetical protein
VEQAPGSSGCWFVHFIHPVNCAAGTRAVLIQVSVLVLCCHLSMHIDRPCHAHGVCMTDSAPHLWVTFMCSCLHVLLHAQESEGEDAEASRVVLPSAAPGRASKALAGRQSRVRLHEVGPRLELEIVKVGAGSGEDGVLVEGTSLSQCLPECNLALIECASTCWYLSTTRCCCCFLC